MNDCVRHPDIGHWIWSCTPGFVHVESDYRILSRIHLKEVCQHEYSYRVSIYVEAITSCSRKVYKNHPESFTRHDEMIYSSSLPLGPIGSENTRGTESYSTLDSEQDPKHAQ